MIISSINRIDVELKKSSYENIWLSGGNTSFKELDGKLVYELKNKLGKGLNINIFENETHSDVIEKIIYIYCKLHKEVGYVQGMNESS